MGRQKYNQCEQKIREGRQNFMAAMPYVPNIEITSEGTGLPSAVDMSAIVSINLQGAPYEKGYCRKVMTSSNFHWTNWR